MALLSDSEIKQKIGEAEGWSREGDAITKTFENDDFVGSVKFVDSLVAPAEDMGHHPDVSISWDKVKVTITNHAEGGLTRSDFELAGKIDALG
jgi:4a-hydroxytetrahydrobiopterin dehydratase